MSDSIVKALVKVKCPYALQSHQIQGLDLDRIFPVIQWLVKKVVETRLVTGDLVRVVFFFFEGEFFLLSCLCMFTSSFAIVSHVVRLVTKHFSRPLFVLYLGCRFVNTPCRSSPNTTTPSPTRASPRRRACSASRPRRPTSRRASFASNRMVPT